MKKPIVYLFIAIGWMSPFLLPIGVVADAPKKAEVTIPEGIQTTLSTYLKAFQTGKLEYLKQSTSYAFFHSTGGEESWKKTLPGLMPKYKNAKIAEIETKKPAQTKGPNEAILVSFAIVAGEKVISPKDGSWFLLKKSKTGKWLIDSQFQDEQDPGP